MSISRRDFVKRAAGFAALGATGMWSPQGLAQVLAPDAQRRYMVLITLRGGFDSHLSLNPQDGSVVGQDIDLGYLGQERIAGSKRLFGPYIGGLEKHDDDLCLLHGVRSDTTSHPDGLKMLAWGRRRPGKSMIARVLGDVLPGDAPLKNLDLVSGDGKPLVREDERPSWADLRSEIHRERAEALGGDGWLVSGVQTSQNLSLFLHDAQRDASRLDARFESDLGSNLRLAFQAVRGNWARCIQVASRGLWYDSHSDNFRFQKMRQLPTWADVSTFLELLKDTSNEHGRLFDQTTVAVFSEFGRFPRLNGEKGKDHFPENSWLLAGGGVRGGISVGETDAVGKSTPVNFDSGLRDPENGRPMFIDSAFATLVAIAGGDPESHGYSRSSVIAAVKGI